MANSAISRYNSSLATDPLRGFRFVATFTPTAGAAAFSNKITTGWTGGFTSISGLQVSTQNIQYREGGYNTTIHQIPGMTTFNPISLNRGVIYKNAQAINWMKYLFAATAGDGTNLDSVNNDFRLDLRIYVLDHPNAAGATSSSNTAGANKPKMGFWVHNAWISTLNYSDLDAGGNNIMVETIGLVHEGLSVFLTIGNNLTVSVFALSTFLGLLLHDANVVISKSSVTGQFNLRYLFIIYLFKMLYFTRVANTSR